MLPARSCIAIYQQRLTTIRQAFLITNELIRKVGNVYEERDVVFVWCTHCRMDVERGFRQKKYNNSKGHKNQFRPAGIPLPSDRDPCHCHTCGDSFYVNTLQRNVTSNRHLEREAKGNL